MRFSNLDDHLRDHACNAEFITSFRAWPQQKYQSEFRADVLFDSARRAGKNAARSKSLVAKSNGVIAKLKFAIDQACNLYSRHGNHVQNDEGTADQRQFVLGKYR